jgi:hypothetical protein
LKSLEFKPDEIQSRFIAWKVQIILLVTWGGWMAVYSHFIFDFTIFYPNSQCLCIYDVFWRVQQRFVITVDQNISVGMNLLHS